MAAGSATFPALRESIDSTGMSARQMIIIFVCFLLNLADGFDVVAMAVAAPSLAGEWGIAPAQLGVIFSAALFGMALGAMFLAPLCDVLGRRRMTLLSVVAISAAMTATAFANNLGQLIALRTITGLGIGVILAVSNTIATEFAPEKFRNLSVVVVTSGFSCGALLVGPIAGIVIPTLGWETLFIGGGVFSLAILIISVIYIPESLEFLAAKKGDEVQRLNKINATLAKIRCPQLLKLPSRSTEQAASQGNILALIAPGTVGLTLRLWVIFFFGFATNYFLASWIPSLFVNVGFSRLEGIAALTIYTGGGVLGVWTVGLLTTKMRMRVLLPPFMFTATLIMLALAWQRPDTLPVLNALMFILGATTVGGFTGVYAVSARSYPAEIRSTGVGWCLGLGRFGAIASPTLAGFLIAQDWNMYGLFVVFGVPFAIAALVMLTIDA